MSGNDDSRPRFGRLILEDALESWREAREKDADKGHPGEHATRDDLRRMAGPGGLLQASPETVDHVSRCPRCWTEWSAMVRAHVEAGEPRGAPTLDYGLLEAAATQDAARARQLRTTSGSYVLTLAPNVDDSSRGLITLEVATTFAPSLEGRRVKVHARASGDTLIEGVVRNGYLARRCEHLAAVDLSRGWTVVVADIDP